MLITSSKKARLFGLAFFILHEILKYYQFNAANHTSKGSRVNLRRRKHIFLANHLAK